MLGSLLGLNGIDVPARYASALGPIATALIDLGVNFDRALDPLHGGARWLPPLVLFMWLAPNPVQLFGHRHPALGVERMLARDTGQRLLVWQPSWRWGLAFGLLAAVAVLGLASPTAFLYFRF